MSETGEDGTVGIMGSPEFDGAAIERLDDDGLTRLIAEALSEQHRRAVEGADIDALIEWGFANGFSTAGQPRDPSVQSGVLVVTGSRLSRGSRPNANHDCTFVSVGGVWVWEHQDLMHDVIRNLPGPKPQMLSVSLLPALEGLELDLVSSQYRQGAHRLRSSRSFQIAAAELNLVSTRAVAAKTHR